METLLQFIDKDTLEAVAYTGLGTLLALFGWPAAKKLALKTKTKTDDELIAKAQVAVDEAIAKKKAKLAAKKAAAKNK